MTLYSAVALTISMFFLAVTPGPGVLLTVSQSLASGFRSAVPVILGIISGDLLFVLLALFGMSAVFEAFPLAFKGVQLFGVSYLCWLGWRYWSRKPRANQVFEAELSTPGARFACGFMTIFADPKVVLFYIGFLQTFISVEPIALLDAFWATSIIIGVIATVMAFYALLATQARRWFQSHTLERSLNRFAGLIMLISAVGLAINAF
ncbi:LysE family translocator [Thiomicrorhabdus xiamenensis]|uniref:LysE family translocator n=1 Tax=Thiomicrorhabdus xiamenensis TaxID=2739063 RepID=A0A7D4SYH1_9GAMM|nr:LysE family translocator [Thiomicrorhabdus xiamenensis]QKI89044.1 LysE family translocator [Thiomicrorhabdus xiamenensis]